MFKIWSESNPELLEKLKPDLGLRSWNELNDREKEIIWLSFNNFFSLQQSFVHNSIHPNNAVIIAVIKFISDLYKARDFTPNFLLNSTEENAREDFRNIFFKGDENIVMELISLYARYCKELSVYKKRIFEFQDLLNDTFSQFGIKYILTDQGFIPRQESIIISEVFDPVLKSLSDSKWNKVNENLSDAFVEYRKNTPQGYSQCVTYTHSALQAFLQILVYGVIGKGDVSSLITMAKKNKIIPADFFTEKIFSNMESIFARERQETSIAHPKKEYANEKNARLLLNLVMIFIQHCMQN